MITVSDFMSSAESIAVFSPTLCAQSFSIEQQLLNKVWLNGVMCSYTRYPPYDYS